MDLPLIFKNCTDSEDRRALAEIERGFRRLAQSEISGDPKTDTRFPPSPEAEASALPSLKAEDSTEWCPTLTAFAIAEAEAKIPRFSSLG